MNSIRYFSIDDCKREIFPFIYEELTETESAPSYESEADGMRELGKVLEFMQNDAYYQTFYDKAAYLICSIAGSQYFSNGNKRLGISALIFFLMKNKVQVSLSTLEGKALDDTSRVLSVYFPQHRWETNTHLERQHTIFLYNLALVLGDRSKWGTANFGELWQKVSRMFDGVYWFDRFL